MSQFLDRLFEEGRVMVSAPEPVQADELRAAESTLAALEAVYRLDLPGDAPPVTLAAGRWAAVSLFHACQFVAFRNADEEMIAAALGGSIGFQPVERSIGFQPVETDSSKMLVLQAEAASLHYSVDLTFRFLPDLMRLARSDAENDPLLGCIRQWAIAWPLSSVGIPDVTPGSIEPIVHHPCLLNIYCDRIIARKDRTRLGDPRIDAVVQQAVGEAEAAMYHE
jgi:hypothetical protein